MKGSYPRTKAIMEDRRKRAEEVQARSAGLTPQEALAKLNKFGLVATKERLKLAIKIRQAEEAPKKAKK